MAGLRAQHVPNGAPRWSPRFRRGSSAGRRPPTCWSCGPFPAEARSLAAILSRAADEVELHDGPLVADRNAFEFGREMERMDASRESAAAS